VRSRRQAEDWPAGRGHLVAVLIVLAAVNTKVSRGFFHFSHDPIVVGRFFFFSALIDWPVLACRQASFALDPAGSCRFAEYTASTLLLFGVAFRWGMRTKARFGESAIALTPPWRVELPKRAKTGHEQTHESKKMGRGKGGLEYLGASKGTSSEQ